MPRDMNMTLEEMVAAGQRADRIKAAKERYAKAKERLAYLKRFREPQLRTWEHGWTPKLTLQKGDTYGNGAITFEVFLPYPIVEQQLVDALNAAHRELIQLGGTP